MASRAAKMVAGAAGAVILAGTAYLGYQYEYGSERTVVFTVRAVDDQPSGAGHKYLIFTTSGQVYEDADSGWHFKTDSSTVYSFLDQPGVTFDCTVYGYRNTRKSQYPNILDGCKVVRRG